jgi:hypothetical protein
VVPLVFAPKVQIGRTTLGGSTCICPEGANRQNNIFFLISFCIMSKDKAAYNLDINSYSLEEMFGLFNLTYDLTEESMRAAKKKVLMIHPDKSNLPSEYFLFYKEAYEIILDI